MSINKDLMKAKIIKYRGLGYHQAEIGRMINKKQQTVNYHLKQIREEVREHGADDVYEYYFHLYQKFGKEGD